MKITTALYIREDGRILIGEFAEDCKESEVKNVPVTECADQQQALQLIQKHFYEGYNCKIVPDLYPIPGIKYEVDEEKGPSLTMHGQGFKIKKGGQVLRKLAYIIEPPPLAKEENCALSSDGRKARTCWLHGCASIVCPNYKPPGNVFKEEDQEIIEFAKKLFKDQKPIPPEIQKVINERFFEML